MAKQTPTTLSDLWDMIPYPPPDHPNLDSLREANSSLQKLRDLRKIPKLNEVFIREIDLYERELRRFSGLLHSRDHKVAFIGSIGVGKSTAICRLAGLVKPDAKNFAQQSVLEAGAGGTTLCEVHIVNGPKYGMKIVPRHGESIDQDIVDFAEHLIGPVENLPPDAEPKHPSNGHNSGISKETERAIRNMANLIKKRISIDGKIVMSDPVEPLKLTYPNFDDLSHHISGLMKLSSRTETQEWVPDDSSAPLNCLSKLFSDINNGRHSGFTLPRIMEVFVPNPVFNYPNLPIRVIDTKGIDQTAEREDLECHFDAPSTLVVLCSRFNDSPEVSIQSLLSRARDAGIRDLESRTVLLVLPHSDEAEAIRYDDGTSVEDKIQGYQLKEDQIKLRLKPLGVPRLPILFFNAKCDDSDSIRERLVSLIVEFRDAHTRQIGHLSEAVAVLAVNLKKAHVRIAREEADRQLLMCIEKNRNLTFPSPTVKKFLLEAIGNAAAQTVHASVRRQGTLADLDYFHQLAVGSQRLARSRIGERVSNIKDEIQILHDKPDMAPVREFLKRVRTKLEASEDTAYRNIQTTSASIFRGNLQKDTGFWHKCDKRWGGGSGYRDSIRDWTDKRVRPDADTSHELVQKAIILEWNRIIRDLESVLKEPA